MEAPRTNQRRFDMEAVQEIQMQKPSTQPQTIEEIRKKPIIERSRLETRLKAERVEERMRVMPGWERRGGIIDRARMFPSMEAASLYGIYVLWLAGKAGIPASVDLAEDGVLVTLRARRRKGGQAELTEGLLDFAELLG
jgi:hypothetical protein